MFENGMEYVRTDFHLHTRKDKEFSFVGEDNSFVNNYVAALKQAGIGLGVITNHNKFDKDEYKAIRKAAGKDAIFILPGVELTIKEGANGIHTLIVFNPDEWLCNGNNYIQTFLTSAFATLSNPENRNTKSTYDLKNVLERLEEYGKDYFIVFAHVDQSSGLFCECSGGLLESLSEIPTFRKRVLGLQKSKTIKNRMQFKQSFGYIPALVEGSDPKSIDTIGKGSTTFLKIGDFSFSAVKFALLDYGNRVFTSRPDIKHGYIESITFQGGKFNGQTIRMSSGLNALIGIRGSGKSSILEAIRYIFNLSAQADRDYKNMLVKNVFGSGGKATLTVVDKHGKRYFISRIYDGSVYVLDENGHDLNITTQSILDGVQYFGQKDLSNSADHENSLLEKLVSGKVEKKANIDDKVSELSLSISQLIDVGKVPAQIEETRRKKADIEHKMEIYREKGVDSKLKKQTGYATDNAKLLAIQNKIKAIYVGLNKAYLSCTSVKDELIGFESEYNKEIFERVSVALADIDNQVKEVGSAISKIQSLAENFDKIIEILSAQIESLADEFAAIKREINDDSVDIDNFVNMTAEVEACKEELKNLQGKATSRSQIECAFIKAARERNDILLTIFNAYNTEAEKINSAQAELRIQIEFKGDRDGFKAQLKGDFRGSGISDVKYQTISEKFSDYIDLIEDWILSDGQIIRTIVSPTEYAKMDAMLKEQYRDLLRYQVRDKVNIYYHEKLLRHHSIGQRASALILFLLAQADNDVILIDQPEDDLDNKIIYDEVITAIAKRKQDVQFIFATHNANIPVLGDAERVLVVDYQDTKIDVLQGNIDLDETHKQIVDIMEGGKEAFDKRQLIYTTWQ